MSLSKTVAELENELSTLGEQEKKLVAQMAELDHAAVAVPAALRKQLENVLAKLQWQPEAAREADSGRYNALKLLEEATTPPLPEGETPEAVTAAELLFDEPHEPAAALPDWLQDPEQLAPARAGDEPNSEGGSSGLDWLDEMADDDIRAESGPSDERLVSSFLTPAPPQPGEPAG
jgi:hypothetical protein